jgi:hypothetical protein
MKTNNNQTQHTTAIKYTVRHGQLTNESFINTKWEGYKERTIKRFQDLILDGNRHSYVWDADGNLILNCHEWRMEPQRQDLWGNRYNFKGTHPHAMAIIEQQAREEAERVFHVLMGTKKE